MKSNRSFDESHPLQQEVSSLDNLLEANHTWIIRQRVLQLLGSTFDISSPQGSRLGIAKLSGLKLKPAMRFFADKNCSHELLTITPRHLIKTNARFEISDGQTGELLAKFNYHGILSFKLFCRHNWLLFDPQDQTIGSMKEQGGLPMASNMVGGALALVAPRKFIGNIGDQFTFKLHEKFNPVARTMTLIFPPEHTDLACRRLALACALIVCSNQYNEY